MNRRERRIAQKLEVVSPKPSTFPASLRWSIALGALAVLGAGGLFLVLPSSTHFAIDHTNPKAVESGRTVYVAECASCHGVNLEGQPNWRSRLGNGRLPAPPHDASGHTWHHSDRVLFDITKRGPAAYPSGHETDMPAFGNRLSDEEIAAVLAFIKSTWPAEVLRRQPKAKD